MADLYTRTRMEKMFEERVNEKEFLKKVKETWVKVGNVNGKDKEEVKQM